MEFLLYFYIYLVTNVSKMSFVWHVSLQYFVLVKENVLTSLCPLSTKFVRLLKYKGSWCFQKFLDFLIILTKIALSQQSF